MQHAAYILAGIVLTVALRAGGASAADFTTWQKKVPLRFAGYNRAETLADFPALVVFNTNITGFAYNQFLSATNADLRFADSTQTNELNYEVELWDTNTIPGISVPTAVSGLAVWLRADSGVQTNASGAVTNWVDQTGNGRNAGQTVSGYRPLLVGNALNGKAVIRFDGTDDGLDMGNPSAAFPTAATVFVVANLNSDDAYNLLTTRSNTGWWRYNGDGMSYVGVFRTSRLESFCTMPSCGARIFAVESSGARWEMWVDGVSKGTAAANYNAGSDYRIGRPDDSVTGAKNLNGDIAEILIYDRPLPATERQKVGAYLARKYGLPDPYRNGTSFVWVRVPTLAGTNTSIWAFWGKNGATAPAYRTNGAVWASSYLGVWHMDQLSDTDSSPKGYHGTAQGTILQSGGRVGKANDFDPTTDFVKVTDQNDFTLSSDYTVSAWVHRDSLGLWRAFCGTYNGAGFIFALDDTVSSTVQFWDGAWRPSTVAVTPGTWNHLAYTRTGAEGKFYVNGSNVYTRSDAQAAGNGADLELGGGGTSWNSYRFDGRVDEVRIANVKRSPNWLWASWRNQAFPTSFVVRSTVQAGGIPLVLNRTATNVNATSANMNGTLVSTGLASTVVRVFWGTSDAGQVRSGWVATNSFPGYRTAGLMTTNISTLVANTLYYYRYYATNTVGEWWGDPASVLITGEIGIGVVSGGGDEQGTKPIVFSVYRASGVSGGSLVVNYTAGGTASSGLDYNALSGKMTIPSGATNALLRVTPIHDQLTGESAENVIVTLAEGPYLIGPSACVTGTIANSATKGWFVSTTGTDTNTGVSWTTALKTITNGLAHATTAGDEVFVAAGIYNAAALITMGNSVRMLGVDGPAATILRPSGTGYRVISVANAGAVLEGFTVRDGAGNGGGGAAVSAGTITNCWIMNNTPTYTYGGGVNVSGGQVNGCRIANNSNWPWDWGPGGGVFMTAGTVVNCAITNNSGNGGYWISTCSGGGVYMSGGVLQNSLVAGNRATLDTQGHGGGVFMSGGRVVNCTVAGNSCEASRNGGGIYRTGGSVTNTIVSGNKKGTDDQNIYGTNGFFYSCSPDLLTSPVTHNISDDPLFAGASTGNYHILPTSPCVDAGKDITGLGPDFDGAFRPTDGNRDSSAVTDIGCYESPEGSTLPLSCGYAVTPTKGLLSVNAVFIASVMGANTNITWYGWDFDNNGTYDSAGPDLGIVTNTYSLGHWTASLAVSNEVPERATYTKVNAVSVYPTVYYASLTGSSTVPYETLAKGGTNIQAVMNYAHAPGTTAITVRVAAGTWTLPSRLELTKPLAVRSISGPGSTILRKPSGSRVVFVTHAGATLDGFTVQDSTAGGMELQQGVVTNCNIIRNSGAVYGGGVTMSGGVMVDCVVSSNQSSGGNWAPGGGMYVQGGVVRRCRITENTAMDGFWQTLGAGGGAYLHGGVLENCLVARNKTVSDTQGDGGGVYIQLGRVVNCTIVSNVCAASRWGGGVYNYFGGIYGTYGGHITNSIISGNKRGTQEQNLSGTNRYYYCDSPDLAAGVNSNMVDDPLFAVASTGNYHLLPTSPCIDRGKDMAGITTDLDRNARPTDGDGSGSATTDMGCYESPDGTTLPLSCSFLVVPPAGLNSILAQFSAQVIGVNTNITWYGWDFNGDGTNEQEGPNLRAVSRSYGLGVHAVRLTVTNELGSTATYIKTDAVRVYPSVYYVKQGSSHTVPYETWAKAATNIQTVIDYAYAPGNTAVVVYVAAGTYNLKSRLNVGAALSVVSTGGPAQTILRWPGSTGRILYVAEPRAIVSGFTIRDGTVGGLNLEKGTVTNCCVLSNSGGVYGGGVYMTGGTLVDCVVSSNQSSGLNWSPGGGLYVEGGTVRRCQITYNTGMDGFWQTLGSGGGVYLYGGILENCLVMRNKTTSAAQGDGGGVYLQAGRMVNCTVVSNTIPAGKVAGGVFNYNGGIYGTYGGPVTNCIIWCNLAGTATNDLNITNRFKYCASRDLVNGVNGNITANPKFKDVVNLDFHLQADSPCINAGTNQTWMPSDVDLDMNRRLMMLRVDMGCYEFAPQRGAIFQLR